MTAMAFGDFRYSGIFDRVAESGDFMEDSSLLPASPSYLQELEGEARLLHSLAGPHQLPTAKQLLNKEIQLVSQALGEFGGLEKQELNSTIQPSSGTTPQEKTVKLEQKLFIPTEEYPSYNFIGRILGPRGMTVKQMEEETGCDIVVRGQGSVRDEKRERNLSGKSGWEHLAEPLHILVRSEGQQSEAEKKLQHAAGKIKLLLTPNENDDKKKRQLIELAIINGTYRPEPETQLKDSKNFTNIRHSKSNGKSSQ